MFICAECKMYSWIKFFFLLVFLMSGPVQFRLSFIMQPSSAFMQSVYHCVSIPFCTSKSVNMSRGMQLCVELVAGKVVPEGATQSLDGELV